LRGMRRIVAFVATVLAVGVVPSSAGASTQMFTNSTPINILDLNHADPDPSDITASGFTGVVTDVNVFVNGLSHATPDDLEMLLVSPSGQKTDLMNDAGGTADIAGLNISFNDQAAGKIPDNA